MKRRPQKPRDPALKKAMQCCGGRDGLRKALAKIGVVISATAIGNWFNTPAERVLAVERTTIDPDTGKPRVTRHDLRPDLYPRDDGYLPKLERQKTSAQQKEIEAHG